MPLTNKPNNVLVSCGDQTKYGFLVFPSCVSPILDRLPKRSIMLKYIIQALEKTKKNVKHDHIIQRQSIYLLMVTWRKTTHTIAKAKKNHTKH